MLEARRTNRSPRASLALHTDLWLGRRAYRVGGRARGRSARRDHAHRARGFDSAHWIMTPLQPHSTFCTVLTMHLLDTRATCSSQRGAMSTGKQLLRHTGSVHQALRPAHLDSAHARRRESTSRERASWLRGRVAAGMHLAWCTAGCLKAHTCPAIQVGVSAISAGRPSFCVHTSKVGSAKRF